jgi:hypothetical protein
MKYIYFLLLTTLSSCENKQVYKTYKKVGDLVDEAKLVYDSAIIDLKLMHLKKDSLLSTYFSKK